MSQAPSYQIRSDSSEEAQPNLSHLAQELKSLKLWRKQEAILKEKEKIESDARLAILEEGLRILRQKEEKIQERLRTRSLLRRSS